MDFSQDHNDVRLTHLKPHLYNEGRVECLYKIWLSSQAPDFPGVGALLKLEFFQTICGGGGILLKIHLVPPVPSTLGYSSSCRAEGLNPR